MSDLVTITVMVTQRIEVTLDKAKFDEAFMAEFRGSMYPFTTINEHAAHLAQLHARGLYDLTWESTFVEGYGNAVDMGISARQVSQDEEVESQ